MSPLGQFIGVELPIGEHWNIGPSGIWELHLDTVLLTLAASAVLFIVGFIIRRSITSGPPSRLQNAVEAVMQFLNTIIEENLGRDPGTIASIALTLFFFIWVANMIGLLPIPHIHSPTSDINATFALAIMVFILLHIRYIRTSGLSAYKGHYWSNRWFGWLFLNWVSVMLGVVNELSRPLTLAFRLSATSSRAKYSSSSGRFSCPRASACRSPPPGTQSLLPTAFLSEPFKHSFSRY